MVKSAAGREYGRAVAGCLGRCRAATGPVALWIVWGRGRRSGDLDNRTKALQDSLQGLMFLSDSQVTELHAFRRESPRQPYILLGARELE